MRNYRREYDSYHAKPAQKRRRAARNAARRKMARHGKVTKGDGRDVDHKDRNAQNNALSNLRVQSKRKNRGRNK